MKTELEFGLNLLYGNIYTLILCDRLIRDLIGQKNIFYSKEFNLKILKKRKTIG